MSTELSKEELSICNNCVTEFMEHSDDEMDGTKHNNKIPTDPRKIKKCFQLIREKTVTLNSKFSGGLHRHMQKSICILFKESFLNI